MIMNLSEYTLGLIKVSSSFYFHSLIALIFCDILTGYSKAIVTKQFTSRVGLKGLIKHINVILISLILGVVSIVIKQEYIFNTFVILNGATYGISVIENLAILGVKVPQKIIDYINLNLKDDKKNEN